jgi:hypothetical protein
MKRILAATQLLFIFPAALFMIALVVRGLQPLQFEPAHTAEKIVMWYAGRQWTLWVLLIGLPIAVLVIGCATLLPSWNSAVKARLAVRQTLAAIRADPAALVVAASTLAAGVVLAVVAVHMLMN